MLYHIQAVNQLIGKFDLFLRSDSLWNARAQFLRMHPNADIRVISEVK